MVERCMTCRRELLLSGFTTKLYLIFANTFTRFLQRWVSFYKRGSEVLSLRKKPLWNTENEGFYRMQWTPGSFVTWCTPGRGGSADFLSLGLNICAYCRKCFPTRSFVDVFNPIVHPLTIIPLQMFVHVAKTIPGFTITWHIFFLVDVAWF